MQIGVRMQINVCISMIDFMPGNGEHETGIFATFIGKVVRRRGVTLRFLSVHPSVCLFLCLSVSFLSVCLSIYLPVCLSVYFLHVCLSVCLYVWVYLYVCLSFIYFKAINLDLTF